MVYWNRRGELEQRVWRNLK